MRPWKEESVFEGYIEDQEKLKIPQVDFSVIGLDSTRVAITDSITTSFQELRPYLEGKLEETQIVDHLLKCFAIFRDTSPFVNHELAYSCLVPLGEYCMWMPSLSNA
jgi:hypothetical protein